MFCHADVKSYPAELDHLAHQGVRFDDLPKDTRKELRKYLLQKQGNRCAYCERSIGLSKPTRIEHFHPRSLQEVFEDPCKRELRTKREVPVEYFLNNLLICCNGHEGEIVPRDGGSKTLTCDVSKGQQHICDSFHNPATSSHPSLVRVERNGTLTPVHFPATEVDAQKVIDETLNLNTEYLVEIRRKGYVELLKAATKKARVPANRQRKSRDVWQELAERLREKSHRAEYPSLYLSVAAELAAK